MKNTQKLSVLFWLFRAKKSKDGSIPVYYRITIDGLSKDFSLGYKVLPGNWDAENKRVSSQDLQAKIINQRIKSSEADLERHFLTLQLLYEEITPGMLKNVLDGKPAILEKTEESESQSDQTLLNAFDEYIQKFELKVTKKKRSDGTLRHWRSTRRKVADFIQSQNRKKDILLSKISYSFADDFFDYLTLMVDEPLAEVTAKKHIKWTRQVIQTAVRKKTIPQNPLEGFVCSSDSKEVLPLEYHEVEAIYRKRITIDRIAEVRDAFIFQCFTGFAYQDIYNLSPENIIRFGTSGERWLVKDRGKTAITEMVPILPIVEELITQYANHPYCKRHSRLIPVNSNYRYNVYLKELADICGIKRELNTHLARHTFADMMLNNGVPLEDVSKMLGHKNIRTTQRYARVRKQRISANMRLVRDRLFTADGQLVQAV